MKKIVVLLLLASFVGISNAQVLDPEYGPRAWQKTNTKEEVAVSLTHIREADVMWAKRVWRTIDLRQKQNLPLYYPLDSATQGKLSFVQLIYNMLADSNNIGLKAYPTYELKNPYSPSKAMSVFRSSVETYRPIFDDEGYCLGSEPYVQQQEFIGDKKESIVKIRVMEDWFFDKQRSVMDVRILALCIEIPVFQVKETEIECEGESIIVSDGFAPMEGNPIEEIWFYFPDLRSEMATTECYKRFNDAARVSFDDIFLKRMFASYIIREENVYNRSIDQYTRGLDALLEAEKISNGIREYEMNLWQY